MAWGWGREAPREGTDADFWKSADKQAAQDAERERREAEKQAERERREKERGKR